MARNPPHIPNKAESARFSIAVAFDLKNCRGIRIHRLETPCRSWIFSQINPNFNALTDNKFIEKQKTLSSFLKSRLTFKTNDLHRRIIQQALPEHDLLNKN